MRIRQHYFVSGALTALMSLGLVLPVTHAVAQEAAAVPVKANWYTKLVEFEFVKQQAVIPKIDGVMVIDSRPTARKYDIGHIPGCYTEWCTGVFAEIRQSQFVSGDRD